MRSFAIALLAAVAAATEYGMPEYGEGSPSTIVLTSVDIQTITSCAGGCGAHSTPVATAPVEHPSVVVPVPSEVVPSEVHPTATPVAPVPELPETCVGNTVTVTVTVPSTGHTSVAVPNPPFPSSVGSVPVPVVPSGTGAIPSKPTALIPSGIVSPTPSPPAFTGAASQVNAGLFVAGAGAVAALLL